MEKYFKQIGVGGLDINAREKELVNQVLDSNQLTYGQMTKKFESTFAGLHDSQFGLFLNSGTSALQVALQALKISRGWQDGDEVLVPAVTFVATANIVIHNGMVPVFVDVDPLGPLGQEEIFGPLLSLFRARDFEHAIALANNTPYALTAGVFSRSPAHLERAREALEAGNLYVNRGITGALVCRQPFGGYRLSGIGSKAGGPDYLLQFVVPRTITENTLRRGFAPIRPQQEPPSDSVG